MDRIFKIAIAVVIISASFTLITYAYAQTSTQTAGTGNVTNSLMAGSVIVTGMSGFVAF